MVEDRLLDTGAREAYHVVQNLRKACKELGELQASGNEDEKTTSDLRRQIMTGLVQLRMLNKQAQDSVHQTKEDTTRARQELDNIQLDMQNVLYQNKHLRSEIERCTDYESRLESIDLVPIEEFTKDNPDVQTDQLDDHQLTLERLRDEERRRLNLFFIKTRLQETKKQLQSETENLKEDLEDMKTFNSQMNKIVEGAEPLRKTLDKH
ncbi:hypothetical protein TRICI_003818 [Trichomonascus ciferrii]|uniref:Uncharacterized protein n=1 Tax=Trichomonascus ciferrii TaxID=44093 RepID=A0A642V7V9_9ASCO|nr:hypothetical protein TRICI_003818 [Trichomonascus ciferrii]